MGHLRAAAHFFVWSAAEASVAAGGMSTRGLFELYSGADCSFFLSTIRTRG
jgi:hypothetical protein